MEFELPANLSELESSQLDELETQAIELFDSVHDDGPATAESVATMAELAAAIGTIKAEKATRAAAAEQAAAEAAELVAQVHGADEGGDGEDGDAGDDEDAVPDEGGGEGEEAEADKIPVTAGGKIDPADLLPKHRKINVNLERTRQRAPADTTEMAPPRPSLTITAGADIPHFGQGSKIDTLDQLTEALTSRSRSMPVTATPLPMGRPLSYESVPGAIVATVHQHYDQVIDGERTPPADVEALFREIAGPKAIDAMVSAGGWCAPSETRYDFFDLTCEDGELDLPTFGVQRGGVRFPISPTLSDVFTGAFDVTTNPWLWTETDDIATVTGAPNKPCIRVPCPTFTDRRLECYGICLTAGNLTDNAYPEATRHQLGLLNSALFHAANQRGIATLVGFAGPAVTGGGFATGGNGVIAPLLGGIELAAIDYKTRHGMCDDDLLEVVLPFWVRGALRSDGTKRNGVDMVGLSDAALGGWLDRRKVRAQFVSDWQVRSGANPGQATARTDWPTSVQFVLMAAGSVVRGNGMTLDLGVVRDSTLNAENDHTAAWMEECRLYAQYGPAPRLYTVAICTDGTTGANDLTACGL